MIAVVDGKNSIFQSLKYVSSQGPSPKRSMPCQRSKFSTKRNPIYIGNCIARKTSEVD